MKTRGDNNIETMYAVKIIAIFLSCTAIYSSSNLLVVFPGIYRG